MTTGLAILIVLHLERSSLADLHFTVELEPNNTFATAQPINTFHAPVHTEAIQGAIVPGDVDMFALSLPAPGTLVLQLSPIPIGSVHGLQLALFDSLATPITVQNQIGGSVFIEATAVSPGVYYAGVSGLSEAPLSGLHDETFEYSFTISYFSLPGPSGLGLVVVVSVMGLPGWTRRRSV